MTIFGTLSSISGTPQSAFLAGLVFKGLVVSVGGAVAAIALRRFSAATRHMVWTLTVACLLSLPLLAVALPGLNVPILSETGARAHLAPAPVSGETRLAGYSNVLPAAKPGSAVPASHSSAQGIARRPDSQSAALDSSVFSSDAPKLDSQNPAGRAGASSTGVTPIAVGLKMTPDRLLLLAFLLWFNGFFALTVRWLIGLMGVRRLALRATAATDAVWLPEAGGKAGSRRLPEVLESSEAATPLTCGVFRPRIILPVTSRLWRSDRLSVVLLHEMAHVKRKDCLTQALAQLACAVYWFNPLVWLAAGRLRIEAERAADDRVLAVGTRASDYAAHLLEIARSLGRQERAIPAAVMMARPSQLESRLLAILDPRPNRRRLGRWSVMVMTTALVAGLIPLAAARPTGRSHTAVNLMPNPPRSSSSGLLSDASSSGILPGQAGTAASPGGVAAGTAPEVIETIGSPYSGSAQSAAAVQALTGAPMAVGDPRSGIAPQEKEAPEPEETAGGTQAPEPEESAERTQAPERDEKHDKGTGVVPKAVVSALVEALKDKDAGVRREAIRVLSQAGKAVSPEILASALKDSDKEVRAEAARALGLAGGQDAGRYLLGALHDPDEQVRSQAVWALGLKGDENSIQPLAEVLLKDSSVQVRSQAAWALGLKGDSRAMESLGQALLKDSSAQVRSQAAWALGLKGDDRAIEPLIDALKDSSTQVRSQAAWALGLKGNSRAIEPLQNLLKENDGHLKRQAIWALGMILMRSGSSHGESADRAPESGVGKPRPHPRPSADAAPARPGVSE